MPKWIKASEQLPPINVKVVIKDPDGTVYQDSSRGWDKNVTNYVWLDESPPVQAGAEGNGEELEKKIIQDLKNIATTFFRYWWNTKWNNTDEGFDSWAAGEIGSKMIEDFLIQLHVASTPAVSPVEEDAMWDEVGKSLVESKYRVPAIKGETAHFEVDIPTIIAQLKSKYSINRK